MSGVVPVIPTFKFFKNGNNPVSNGSVTVYLAGTTTLVNTWQDSGLTILNTNPVNLDANGECTFWLDPAHTYRFLVTAGLNGTGATVKDVDNIPGASGGTAANLNFSQSGTGAVTRSAQDKMRETFSVKDFGAKGDGFAVDSSAVSIASGTAALTVVGALFTSADVGKSIAVPGAGAAGAALCTTISSVTGSTTVSLAANASTTISSVAAIVVYGSDDTTNIQAAIDAAGTYGAAVFFPVGRYVVTSEILVDKSGVLLCGAGPRHGILFREPSGWASTIMPAAPITGAIFRFALASSGFSVQGCGIRDLSFNDGTERAISVNVAVHVQSAAYFCAENVEFSWIKGTALRADTCIKGSFSNIAVDFSGDTSKPSIWLAGAATPANVQGSYFRDLKVENCHDAPYLQIDSTVINNKFVGSGFEADDATAATLQTFISLAGERNQFIGTHLNSNTGTLPSVSITGKRNNFTGLVASGIHNGDIFSIVGGQENTVTGFNAALDNGGTPIKFADLSTSAVRNNFSCGVINNGNGFATDASSNRLNLNAITHVSKASYTVSSSAVDFRASGLVDDESDSVASAASIVIPDGKDFVSITGTTGISGVTAAAWDGRTITLRFTDVLTVSDGSGFLRLAGDFITASGSILTIRALNGVWYELSRTNT